MTNKKLMLAIVLLLPVSLPVAAGEIYKRVNEDGVMEFSDKPFPGASQVTVAPNVVSTNPVQRRERDTAAEPPQQPAPASRAATPTRSAESTTYVRERNRRAAEVRQTRRNDEREQRRRASREDDTATDPNPGRALRNAARNLPSQPR